MITVASYGSDVPMATHTITGDLTIKNITRSLTIPANISFAGSNLLVGTPSFTIDRTAGRLKYRSAALGTTADLLIYDEVTLVVTFDAVK